MGLPLGEKFHSVLRVDFQCRVVFLKFTFANKIEAMHERSLVNYKLNLAQLLV